MGNRRLIAVHCSVSRTKRIVFRYKDQRWDIFESLDPWDIREALRVALGRIEDAHHGSLAKAAEIDDREWQSNKHRTRRYIAESAELLYLGSPHLTKQSEPVAGHHVLTNIPWRDVPKIIRLVCSAAEIDYGSLSGISFR
jgi:hypothetical protein